MTPPDITEAAERKWPTNTDKLHRNLLNESKQKAYIASRTEERELQFRFAEWLPITSVWHAEFGMWFHEGLANYYHTHDLFTIFLNDKTSEK